VLVLVPGAFALSRAGRGRVAGVLVGAALAMLGVYLWVEPRESRYLVHLLPFLIPVAGSVAILPESWLIGGAWARTARKSAAPWAAAVGIALSAVLAVQAAPGLTHAKAWFLSSDYSREVASRMRGVLRGGEILVAAEPWTMHYRLGAPVWGAGDITSEGFRDAVSADVSVVVLRDTAMRFHDPGLYGALRPSAAGTAALTFEVESPYQYGFEIVPASEPITVVRMPAGRLRALAEDASKDGRVVSGPVEVAEHTTR